MREDGAINFELGLKRTSPIDLVVNLCVVKMKNETWNALFIITQAININTNIILIIIMIMIIDILISRR